VRKRHTNFLSHVGIGEDTNHGGDSILEVPLRTTVFFTV
jgi:hypothetical protein